MSEDLNATNGADSGKGGTGGSSSSAKVDADKSTNETEKALEALRKERDLRKQLEASLKEQLKKEKELTENLERHKTVDPEKYEKLLEESKRREEQELERKKSYEELRERYRLDAESAKKDSVYWKTRYETTEIENAIKTAFFEQGGRKPSPIAGEDASIEDAAPYEAIIALLKDRIKLEDNRIVIYDRVGSIEMVDNRPKTLSEKMIEIRKGHFGALFDPVNNSSGGGMNPQTGTQNGKTVQIYTRQQAQAGQVPLEDIISGKAVIQ